VDYTLVDGGAYDEDHTVNGTIIDPVYFGVVQSSSGSLASTGASLHVFTMVAVVTLFVGIGTLGMRMVGKRS
ncbi:MAG: choice-of-anchor U domain-containing protein, partial [Candidatus Saccharimonas sp.]